MTTSVTETGHKVTTGVFNTSGKLPPAEQIYRWVTAISVDLGKHLNTGVKDNGSKFADSFNNTGSPIADGFFLTVVVHF
jgi:hypothetical protein